MNFRIYDIFSCYASNHLIWKWLKLCEHLSCIWKITNCPFNSFFCPSWYTSVLILMVLRFSVFRKRLKRQCCKREQFKLFKISMMLSDTTSFLLIWGLISLSLFFSLVFGPLFLGNMYICHVFSRENYDTWNLLSKARTEGRLFSKLKWPKDAELVCSDFTPCPCLSFCCYILHSIL